MAASRAIAQSIFAAGDVGAGGGFPLDVGCPVSGLVQDATDRQSVFRPQFAGMFHQPVIGIVTKIETLTAVSGGTLPAPGPRRNDHPHKFLSAAGADAASAAQRRRQ